MEQFQLWAKAKIGFENGKVGLDIFNDSSRCKCSGKK